MKILEKKFPLLLFIILFLTMLTGCALIYSASPSYAWKQLFFVFCTFIMIGVVFLVDLRVIYNSSWYIYIICIGMLIAVPFIGSSSHGAQRWLDIGFMEIQPSEFAKIAIILALAKFMSRHIERRHNVSFIFQSSLIVIFPLILILKQPDLGTSLTLIPILTTMLFMAGIPLRYFFVLAPFAIVPIIIIILGKYGIIPIEDLREMLFFLKPYQQNRLLVYIDPNIDPKGLSYNLIQSQIAIGSGGLYGQGFIAGTQTQLKFLPERHTDFIFSVLGEEWGFMGGIFLLSLYLFLIKSSLSIASMCEDFFPKFVSIGIMILLLSHITINIGMTIGLMPITGLPLPFISYGRSSLLLWTFAISLLINFYSNRRVHLNHFK